MSTARETILARIRSALADAEPCPDVPRDYRRRRELDDDELLDLFVERVEETGARIVRTEDPAGAVRQELERLGLRTVVVASGLPPALTPADLAVRDDADLSAAELDTLDAAVTTCAAACAETATIAFDGGPGQGRRATTLVPDAHVCVVQAEQVVQTVPELFARLEPSAREGRALVLVSGPSATSDIGFERVEGVHGPRQLVVVLVERSRPPAAVD